MSDELKPCPFCGGEKMMAFPPNCTKDGPYNRGDNAQPIVRCMTCFAEAMGAAWDNTKASVITAWNTRTDTIPSAAYVAGLEAALEFYADKGGWNQPPVKTREGFISVEYENQASKIQRDRGTLARAALASSPASPDVRVVTVEQLERVMKTTMSGIVRDEIRAIIGGHP